MIVHSWGRHYPGRNTFYTQLAKEKGIKTVHSFERHDIFNDFMELVLEDIVINMKTVKLPFGTFTAKALNAKGVDWGYWRRTGELVDLTRPETENKRGWVAFKKTRTIKNLRNTRFRLRNKGVKMLSHWFIKNGYKNYIK